MCGAPLVLQKLCVISSFINLVLRNSPAPLSLCNIPVVEPGPTGIPRRRTSLMKFGIMVELSLFNLRKYVKPRSVPACQIPEMKFFPPILGVLTGPFRSPWKRILDWFWSLLRVVVLCDVIGDFRILTLAQEFGHSSRYFTGKRMFHRSWVTR